MKPSPQPLWQNDTTYLQLLPEQLRPWILHAGSFMERLKKAGITDSRIEVIGQNWQIPLSSERKRLGLSCRAYGLIREVLILNNEAKWMFARSVFPRDTIKGEFVQLAHLKNRSLGSFLFNQPGLERSEFELTQLQPDMKWYKKISAHAALSDELLWARRSIFKLDNKEILLTEVFLPSIAAL